MSHDFSTFVHSTDDIVNSHLLQIFKFASAKFKTMLLGFIYYTTDGNISSLVTEAKITIHIGFLNLCTAATTDDTYS